MKGCHQIFQDFQNIQIYICEFIVNKQSDLLLEVLIELYCDYYSSLNQKTLAKFNTCIEIVKNKDRNLYLKEDRLTFNDLGTDLNNLIKTQNLYKKKYETKLLYDPAIIINKLNKVQTQNRYNRINKGKKTRKKMATKVIFSYAELSDYTFNNGFTDFGTEYTIDDVYEIVEKHFSKFGTHNLIFCLNYDALYCETY